MSALSILARRMSSFVSQSVKASSSLVRQMGGTGRTGRIACLALLALAAGAPARGFVPGVTAIAGGSWIQSSPGTSPSARQQAAMAYDSLNGKVVLFGGFNGTSRLGDTWTWDGTTWTNAANTGPSVRQGASMAYDATHNKIVLFGGYDGTTQLHDTWTWDGGTNTWTSVSTAGPGGRNGASMAYDPSGTIVLFGGTNGTVLDDTWTWNGGTNTWSQPSAASFPPPLYGAVMATDAVRGDVVLFGGQGTNGTASSNTWIWNGAGGNWTEASPLTVPPARYGAAMSFDAVTGTSVLFGGSPDGTTFLNDTWIWDGTNWYQQSPASSPAARNLTASAYDAAVSKVVMFGGIGSSGLLADTWNHVPGGSFRASTTNVGSAAAQTSVTFTILTSGALGTLSNANVLTQGTSGLDFTLGTGSTCTGTPNADTVCTVNVAFTPSAPGVRMGVVNLTNSGGTIIATAYISGTGTGPLAVFNPGTVGTLGGGYNAPYGTAVDASGNVYVANFTGGQVLEVPAGCTAAGCVQPLGGASFTNPVGVAVDGGGNVYVADGGTNSVSKMTPGCIATGCVTLLANGFNSVGGIAVDGNGNAYVTESGGGNLKEIPAGCAASGCVTTLVTGFNNPVGVAVDGSGNFYVANHAGGTVQKVAPGCGTTGCATTIATGLASPAGLAVDSSGAVYVASASDNTVKQIPAGCTTSTCITQVGSGFNVPYGVAVDGSGNVYVSNNNNNTVNKVDRVDAPSLTFATTAVGSTSSDSAKTVTLTNLGNAPLMFTIPGAASNNPSISTSFTLASGTTCPQVTSSSTPGPATSVASGATCNIAVNFTPAAHTGGSTVNGQVTLTDNSLNATQTISLQGAASLSPPTISGAFAPAAIHAGNTSTLTYTLGNPSDNSNVPLTNVSFTDTLPAGLVIATPANVTTACGASLSAVSGGSQISLSGLTISGGGVSCALSVNVTSGTKGTYTNVTSAVTATETSAGGTSTATLNVLVPPSISQAWSPTTVLPNANSTVSFTLGNTNSITLSDISFSDTFPTGLSFQNITSFNCGGSGSFSNSTNVLSLGGLSVPANSTCTIGFALSSATPGSYANTSGAVSSTSAGTGNTSAATLTVGNPTQLAFGVSPALSVPVGGNAGSTVSVQEELASGTVSSTSTDLITLKVSYPDGSTAATYSHAAVNGVATFDLSSFALTHAGSYSYVASATSLTSATAAGAVVANTFTLLSSGTNPAPINTSVTFTATVASSAPAIGTPTGSVVFSAPGQTSQTIALTNGSAQASFSFVTAGPVMVSAAFQGSTYYTVSNTSISEVAQKPFHYLVATLADDASAVPANCVDGATSGASGNSNCSLRDAIEASNAVGLSGASSGTTISFLGSLASAATPGTINVTTGGMLTINQSVTVAGPGANALTVSGGGSAQILNVTNGQIVLSGLTFSNGNASTSAGAIVANGTTSSLSLTGDAFLTNSGQLGGAVSVATGSLTVTNSTFANNTSSGAGAISVTGSSLKISNSTFLLNNGTGNGAINATASSPSAIVNSTFSGNTSTSGAAVSVSGTIAVSNSIFVGNTGGSTGGAALSGTGITATNNVFFNNIAGGVESDCFQCTANNGMVSGDPKLSVLGNNGGLIQTMLPLPGSVAICAVPLTSSTLPSATTNQQITDQRGATHSTAYCSSTQLDAGAVQTSYSLGTAFTTQPPSEVSSGVAISPNPAVTVTEKGAGFSGASIAMTAASGTVGGTTSETSVATTGLATFDNLKITGAQPGDDLVARLTLNSTVSPAIALTLTSTTFTSVTVTAPPVLTGQVAVMYSQSVSASNATAPYSYTVSSGALPAGLTLAPTTGLISGIPTAGGTFSVTVTATDQDNATGFVNFSLVIAPPVIVVTSTPSPLPVLQVGVVPTFSFAANAGTAPYSYSVTVGSMPAGLTLGANGNVTGVPSTAGPYSFTVTATDSSTGTGPYTGSQSYSGTVDKGAAKIIFNTSTLSQTYTGSPLSASAATLPTAFTLTYSYVGTGSTTYAASATPPTNAGTYDVTATVVDPNYAGVSNPTLFTINKATPTITTTPTASPITYGAALSTSTLNNGVASVGGLFSWTNGATVPTAGTASYSVTFTPNDTADYNTVTLNVSIAVSKATPTITTLPTASAITFGQTLASSTLTGGVASVGGSFSWTTSSTAPNGGTANYSVTFTPTDTANYNTTTGLVSVITNPATQTLTFTQPTSPLTYGATTTVALSATATSGLTPAFSIVSGPGSISGSTLTITGAGTIVVAADQTGNTNYSAATEIQRSIVVNMASQTITFPQPASPITYGSVTTVALGATGGASSNAVTYSIVSGPGSINGSTLTITGAGTIVIAADQLGNANYNVATEVQRSIVVNLASQTITFAQPASSFTYGSATSVTLSATGGASSNAVTFSVVSGPGTVNGSTLTITGAGTIVVAADELGNTNYSAATEVQRNVVVNKASAMVSAPALPVSVIYTQAGSVPVVIAGQYAGAGIVAPGGTISYAITSSSNTTVASGTLTISTGTVTVPVPNTLAAGRYTVTDSYGGDANYSTAQSSFIVQVGQIQPVIVWSQPSAITFGTTLANVLTAAAQDQSNPPAKSVAGSYAYLNGATPITATTVLPAGSYTLTVNFTPTDATTYKTATGSVTLTVNKATPAVSLQPSVNLVLLQNPVTLTATVPGTATGSVMFLDGTTSLGTATVVGGVATVTTTTLAVGSHSITAVYTGDSNFVTQTTTATTVQVSDFSLNIAGSNTSQTVLPGATATFNFTLAPSGSTTFPAALNLSVGGLPPGATYTITPQTIASGAGSTNVTLLISLPTQVSMLHTGEKLAPLALALLLLPFGSRIRRKSRKLTRLMAMLLLLIGGAAGMATLSGCGAKASSSAPTPLTYNITITGTSGALSHSTSVSLTVQ